ARLEDDEDLAALLGHIARYLVRLAGVGPARHRLEVARGLGRDEEDVGLRTATDTGDRDVARATDPERDRLRRARRADPLCAEVEAAGLGLHHRRAGRGREQRNRGSAQEQESQAAMHVGLLPFSLANRAPQVQLGSGRRPANAIPFAYSIVGRSPGPIPTL